MSRPSPAACPPPACCSRRSVCPPPHRRSTSCPRSPARPGPTACTRRRRRSVAAHRWGDAARLHRRSAELRDADDPLGFRCLKEAAALAYATGDRTTARKDMTAAAGQALARGDLREAAARVPRRRVDRAGAEEPAAGVGARAPRRDAGGLAAARCVRSRGDPAADRAGAGGRAAGDAAGAVGPTSLPAWAAKPGGRGSSCSTTGS